MNWPMIWGLVFCLLFWLLVGWWAWHHEPLPPIFGTATVPVPADELLTLNPD